IDFSFTRYNLINEKDEEIGKTTRYVKKLSYFKYLHHCFTGCLTVMYKKSIAPEIRSYNIKNNNDYGLFLQIVKNCENASGMPDLTAHYRIRSKSISRNKFHKIKPYMQLMHDNLKFPYVLCCWFLFTNVVIGKIWKYEHLI
ncbi:MAG: hypothetical protein HUJ68_02700, partial [Clostridia bacterium]|nr:hypothetical protein [Clostridia bacterium]